MDSILNTIKKMLGIDISYTAFDVDIIVCINTAFFILQQLNVGPTEGFRIFDSSSVWDDFSTRADIEAVKSYVYLKTRVQFDPPSSSFVLDAMKNQIQEYEWRLNVQCDS